ncbi:unnamed protein product, partial [marine sediment metagenome]
MGKDTKKSTKTNIEFVRSVRIIVVKTREIPCIDNIRIIFAFAWSRGLIGKDATVEEPDSSIFRNPTMSIGGINKYIPSIIDHSTKILSIVVTSPIIGPLQVSPELLLSTLIG